MIIVFVIDSKMLLFKLSRVLVLAFLHCIAGQRRIKDGFNVQEDKPYVVYLIQATTPFHKYFSWICGGSIVSRWYILTSAACVEDVQSMYAISGIRNYVPSTNVFENQCTERTRRKIVFTCVPKEYELDLKVENWSYNDIAIVKVESPYDFRLDIYERFCDYKPTTIKMNFNVKNEQEGMDVIVLGYGHKSIWREHKVNQDFNTHMQYSSSKINSVEKCKKLYTSPDLVINIDKYMICTNGSGSIDEVGKPLNKSSSLRERTQPKHNLEVQSTGKDNNNNLTLSLNTRRQGICQNDHGGPLVAWINGQETVIGVASVFRVDLDRKCTGPYLYTSTARNKLFIECVIDEQTSRKNNLCYQPASKLGFSISRRYILWNENKDHVVNIEEIKIRPQINMDFIREG